MPVLRPLADTYGIRGEALLQAFSALGLTFQDYGVYRLLCDTADRTGISRLTLSQLQAFVRCRRQTLISILRRLEEVGLLRIERRPPHRNVYRLFVLAKDEPRSAERIMRRASAPSAPVPHGNAGSSPAEPPNKESRTLTPKTANNNHHSADAEAVVVPLAPPELDAVCKAYEAAVGRPIRRSYALALIRRHGAQAVLAKVRLLADALLRGAVIHNPEGWLRAALLEDWQPPQAASRARIEAQKSLERGAAALAEVAAAKAAVEAVPLAKRKKLLEEARAQLFARLRASRIRASGTVKQPTLETAIGLS